jgi:hypothetical protein
VTRVPLGLPSARLAAGLACCAVVLGLVACSADRDAAPTDSDAVSPEARTPASSTAFGSGPGSDDPHPATDDAGTQAPEPGADATVFLTYAGYDADEGVQVSGYVADLVEQGGTCTLTLTGAGGSASVSSPAQPDARTTTCGHLTVPRADVTPGTWEATLSYRSARSAGTSEAMEVTVP